MPEVFNIGSIPLTLEGSMDLVRQLHVARNQEFLLSLDDGEVVMTGRWLCVNIFLWRPLVKRNYPVSKRHTCFSGKLFTKDVLAKIHTEIYNDVVDISRTIGLSITGEVESEILYDLMETYDHMHHWISRSLGEYHLSISAFDLCRLLHDPQIKPLTKIDISKELSVSIGAAEAKLKKQGDQIVEKLKDTSIPNNVIAPFLNLGLISSEQLPRVVMALGFRTDASDQIVRHPITTSYVEGIASIVDFAVESLDAKKTIYYNRIAMPDSQYGNRQQQILACSVRRLYPGDCGSKLVVPFYIHKDNAQQVLDANIVIDDGQMVCLSKHNIDQFIGYTVNLKNPLSCRHTNGICHACGGRLTDFMHPDIVIGIASTVEYMSAASQLVLSAKHFSKTNSISYAIPEELREVLVVRQNDIFIQNGVDVSRLKIKINYSDVEHINELKSNEDGDEEVSAIAEQQFSKINYLMFLGGNDVPLTPEIPMISEGTVPYFSEEMISYMKDNFRSITIGDEVVIPLKKFNHTTEPLLRCVVESNSMIKFNKTLEKFVQTDIRKYTSLSDVLTAFSNIVYKEIKTNIMHLSVVLKSYLITSDDNFNIPVVEDVNNVRFEGLGTIIPKRSLGQQFAYQELLKYISDPSTYTLPHPRGILDIFFYEDA